MQRYVCTYIKLAGKPVGFKDALYWSTMILHAWHEFHKMSVILAIAFISNDIRYICYCRECICRDTVIRKDYGMEVAVDRIHDLFVLHNFVRNPMVGVTVIYNMSFKYRKSQDLSGFFCMVYTKYKWLTISYMHVHGYM